MRQSATLDLVDKARDGVIANFRRCHVFRAVLANCVKPRSFAVSRNNPKRSPLPHCGGRMKIVDTFIGLIGLDSSIAQLETPGGCAELMRPRLRSYACAAGVP
jgi:hypothetical protein